jgi:hypothetical protein
MMRLLSDAARLSRSDRALALQAAAWLVLARIALHLTAYATVRRALVRIPPRPHSPRSATPAACGRATERAARLLPHSTCLARALATAALVRRHGYASTLDLHVTMTSARELDAHATLEVDGTVIVGGDSPRGQTLMRDHVALP